MYLCVFMSQFSYIFSYFSIFNLILDIFTKITFYDETGK